MKLFDSQFDKMTDDLFRDFELKANSLENQTAPTKATRSTRYFSSSSSSSSSDPAHSDKPKTYSFSFNEETLVDGKYKANAVETKGPIQTKTTFEKPEDAQAYLKQIEMANVPLLLHSFSHNQVEPMRALKDTDSTGLKQPSQAHEESEPKNAEILSGSFATKEKRRTPSMRSGQRRRRGQQDVRKKSHRRSNRRKSKLE